MPETVAVLGCGSIGQRHIRNLLTLGVGQIVAFDRDPERLRLAAALGAAPASSTSAALAGAAAVLVCTPPTAHLDGLRRALEAGSHVFVEKPVAAVLDGLDEIAALARRQARIVLVGYNLRFHTGLVRLRELLEMGSIGRLLSVQAEFGYALPAWRPTVDYRTTYTARRSEGGGILLDASHEIDYVRWLVGEIDTVAAMTGKLSDLEMDAEDTALLLLRASNGVLASLHLDCVQSAYRRACRLVGSDGILVWDYLTGVSRYVAREGAWREEAVAPTDPNDMYVVEIAHFLACVDGRETPRVTLEDGRRALEIVVAAQRSARERREVSL